MMKRPRRNLLILTDPTYTLLEGRNLLAGIQFDPLTGVVTIEGSTADDSVQVFQPNPTQLTVTFVNVGSQTFERDAVTSLLFLADFGNDWFRNNSAVNSVVIGGDGADRLVGGSGRDEFHGGLGSDRMLGMAGDDDLRGNEGNDVIEGGMGNDSIWGLDGNDRLGGGADNDEIFGNAGDDFIDGSEGHDTIFGYMGNDFVYGGNGNDIIAGQDGDDRIHGQDGLDTIYGNDGDDQLLGGADSDQLIGGNGLDQLFGEQGSDRILGQAGNDLIQGGGDQDQIFGGDDDDTAYGGPQNDRVFGGLGDDRVFGQEGLDSLFGDPGSDIVVGGPDADLIRGGTGNDDLYGDSLDDLRNDDEDDASENQDQYVRPTGLSNRLTLSFAPDGTEIFDQVNSFFSTFAGFGSPSEIENVIIQSFGLWAANGNLDIGVVADSGLAFGTPGRGFGDPRFGDVRVGAIPMAGDIYAIAIGQGDVVSGTWAGDILFNSNATYKNFEKFKSVALHEVGHSLGLKHETDIDSVMHRYSNRLDLSDLDIANFQVLYGQRRLDEYDTDEFHNNDDDDSAVTIEFSEHHLVAGMYPAIVYGDVSSTIDQDFFRFELPENYQGMVTVEVVSEGISLLAPHITILNQAQQILGDLVSDSLRGDRLSMTLPSDQFSEPVFFLVQGNDLSSTGSYSLIVTLDDNNVASEETILAAARRSELSHLGPDELARFFADPTNFKNDDDQHSNDDFDSANQLESEDGFPSQTRFLRYASLTDSNDVDIYKIQSPTIETGESALLVVSLRSIEPGGMVPVLQIRDEDKNLVPATIVVNGRGEYAVQVENVMTDKDYFIEVRADSLLPFQAGNYELNVFFETTPIQLIERASGSLDASTPQIHSLHVAESQMMEFAFEVGGESGDVGLAWITIFDPNGVVMYRGIARPGERRTSNTVYFAPGSYSIVVQTVDDLLQDLDYRLWGVEVGDGQGPTFSDASSSPFEKRGDGSYVYPDDVISKSTFVLVDGLSSNQPPPPPNPPPSDLYAWYWGLPS